VDLFATFEKLFFCQYKLINILNIQVVLSQVSHLYQKKERSLSAMSKKKRRSFAYHT
jgi:hypothetical protein